MKQVLILLLLIPSTLAALQVDGSGYAFQSGRGDFQFFETDGFTVTVHDVLGGWSSESISFDRSLVDFMAGPNPAFLARNVTETVVPGGTEIRFTYWIHKYDDGWEKRLVADSIMLAPPDEGVAAPRAYFLDSRIVYGEWNGGWSHRVQNLDGSGDEQFWFSPNPRAESVWLAESSEWHEFLIHQPGNPEHFNPFIKNRTSGEIHEFPGMGAVTYNPRFSNSFLLATNDTTQNFLNWDGSHEPSTLDGEIWGAYSGANWDAFLVYDTPFSAVLLGGEESHRIWGGEFLISSAEFGLVLQNFTFDHQHSYYNFTPLPVGGPVAFMEPIQATTTRTPVTFQDNSTGISPITQFDWTLDGVQKSGEVVQHTFSTPGVKEFSHSVTDDVGRESTIRGLVEISQVAPSACQSFVKATIQLDEVLEYSDCSSHPEAARGGAIVSRLWDFKDSSTSFLVSGSHQFQAVGDYDVSLTVTDDQGVQNVTVTSISVVPVPNQAPAVSFTVSPVDAVHGQESVFTATATDEGSVSYKWFVDGVERGASSTLTRALAPGDRVVRVVVQDAEGLEAEASKTVTVAPRAKAIVTVPSVVEFEKGSVSFEASIKNPNPVGVTYSVEIGGLPVGWSAPNFEVEIGAGELVGAVIAVEAGTQVDRLVKVRVEDGLVLAERQVEFVWLESVGSSSSSSAASSTSSSSQSVHSTTESKDSPAAFMFGPLLVALALVQLKRRRLD